jgi:hypothetical protein
MTVEELVAAIELAHDRQQDALEFLDHRAVQDFDPNAL